jgi:hypothetical protein
VGERGGMVSGSRKREDLAECLLRGYGGLWADMKTDWMGSGGRQERETYVEVRHRFGEGIGEV